MNGAHADVLVVGGGVLGTAHAVAALRSGRRVVLCERDAFARSASVRNFGMVWPIGQPAGPDLDLALHSRALWREMAELAGFRCEPTGSLHLAYAADEWAVLQQFAAGSPLPGLELLSPERVVGLQPAVVRDGLCGALWSPHEANVDPGVAVRALHAWLRREGADVRTGCAVVRIDAPCADLADGTTVTAEHIVVCSGDDFATLFSALFAASDLHRCKLQMLSFAPSPRGFRLGPMLAAGLTLAHYRSFLGCPALPALVQRLDRDWPAQRARGVHVLVSQGDDGRLIVGDSHTYGDEFPPGLDATTEAAILDYLATFLRVPPTVTARWSGTYALRRSGASTFRAAPMPGVEIVTGVGGSGMTRSFGLGAETVGRWRGQDGDG